MPHSNRIRPLACSALLGAVCLLALTACSEDKPAKPIPPDPEVRAKLISQWREKCAARDYPAAAAICEEIARIDPGDGGSPYNAACMWALAGNRDKALQWFEEAGIRGFSDPLFESDPDLKLIRGDARFERTLRKMRDAQKRRLDEFRQIVRSTQMFISGPQGSDEPVPLIVGLHDYNENMNNTSQALSPLARRVGAALVAPAAIRINRNDGGIEWGPVDEVEIVVNAAIETAAARMNIDRGRVILFGLGHGGDRAWTVALRNPGLFAGVISAGAALPAPELEAALRPGADKLRGVMIVNAAQPNQSVLQDAFAAVRKAGIACELKLVAEDQWSLRGLLDREMELAYEFVLSKKESP